LEDDPALALQPRIAAEVLAEFFKDHDIATPAGRGDWQTVRRRVNGGLNGWPRFQSLVLRLRPVFSAPARRGPRVAADRTLHLSSPTMRGPDVVAVQRALHLPQDGQYGPLTASAVAAWKRSAGYPPDQVDTSLGPRGRRWLLGLEPLPADYRSRAATAGASSDGGSQMRTAAVREMEAWADAGVRETPPGQGKVPALVKLATALDVAAAIRGMGFHWGAFAAFLSALAHDGQSADAGLRKQAFNALYCPDILTHASHGRFGLSVVPRTRAARGDLVIFDLPGGEGADHVGRLLAPPSGSTVRTVDGGSGTSSQVVRRLKRRITLVRAFVRDS
jgi:hypothetical protein